MSRPERRRRRATYHRARCAACFSPSPAARWQSSPRSFTPIRFRAPPRPARLGIQPRLCARPGAPSCPIFPADNPWNQRVDKLPVAKNSARLIAAIGLENVVHPDFGTTYNGAPNGIPFAVVSNKTRRVPVSFQYASESDGHLYPLPRDVPIEGGPHAAGDRHVIVVNRDTCTDYELFDAQPLAGGKRWKAGSGAIFNLRSDHLRPAGWTSADAAGLPILPDRALTRSPAA